MTVSPILTAELEMSKELHTPVLLDEVLELTQPAPGNVILDATLGLGGHAEAFLQKIGSKGQLIGFDADSRNLALAKTRLEKYSQQLLLHNSNFRSLGELTQPESVDVVLFDLGVSSPHFDDPLRGFSFRSTGPLDMRLDQTQELTAAEIINSWPEAELTQIFVTLGEIRTAAKVARQIVTARKLQKIQTTTELADVITAQSLLPQIFQALRMTVNSELESLEKGLLGALQALKSGGYLAVISFHSLEDRLVKNFLRERKNSELKILTKKVIQPSAAEVQKNPRARSAKLRVAKKC